MRKQWRFFLLVEAFATLLVQAQHPPCQHRPIDPYRYLASLEFDGQDWWDEGEKFFPVSFRFNTSQDANNDGVVNQEDNLENYVPFTIGWNVYGTGTSGLPARGPNDQRPAVYYHHVHADPFIVHQYWLYYVDNDWLNNHEHEWEVYFVYTIHGVITHVGYSWHNTIRIATWCEIRKDDTHPLIGVDGGSHAMKNNSEDGVLIRYNGHIYRRNGQLNTDSLYVPWVIYSNDSQVTNAVPYLAYPDTFFYGDPYHGSDEYSDPRPAAWAQTRWKRPELPSAVPFVPQLPDTIYLCPGDSIELCAGSGAEHYRWNTGDTTPCITLSAPGKYWIDVVSTYDGCQRAIPDTVIVRFYERPTIFAQDTIYKCQGQQVLLQVPTSLQIVSSNISWTDHTLQIDSGQMVKITVMDSAGCQWKDSLRVIDTTSWLRLYPISSTCWSIEAAFVDTATITLNGTPVANLPPLSLPNDTFCLAGSPHPEGLLCVEAQGLCGNIQTCSNITNTGQLPCPRQPDFFFAPKWDLLGRPYPFRPYQPHPLPFEILLQEGQKSLSIFTSHRQRPLSPCTY